MTKKKENVTVYEHEDAYEAYTAGRRDGVRLTKEAVIAFIGRLMEDSNKYLEEGKDCLLEFVEDLTGQMEILYG